MADFTLGKANADPDRIRGPRPSQRGQEPEGRASAGVARASHLRWPARNRAAASGLLRPSAVPARLVTQVLREPGQPLAAPLQQEMEARLGAVFSDVRVHDGSAARASAAAIGARAYTRGSHVVLGDGGTDKHTLAHELTHVVQQRAGSVADAGADAGVHVSNPADRFERAAESNAVRAVSGSAPHRARPSRVPASAPSSASSAAQPIQRKIDTGRGVYNQPDHVPGNPQLSAFVSSLVSARETYYLPDNPAPDLSLPVVLALEKKKYLLGEKHGDGSWQQRTDRWTYIPKMRESIRWFRPETPEEGRAVTKAEKNPVIDLSQGLPLEDIHSVFLTKVMSAQQMLGDFDNLSLATTGPQLLNSELSECYTYLAQYYQVAEILHNEEFSGKTPPKGSRAWDLISLGYSFVHYKTELNPVWEIDKKKAGALTKAQASALRPVLESLAELLIELIDTRPRETGIKTGIKSVFGFEPNRVGPDPLGKSRAQLISLSDPKSTGAFAVGFLKALSEGNVLREEKMAENIKAAPAPLLVQLGSAHVPKMAAALGNDAVPVDVGEDFEALVERSGLPGNAGQPVMVAAQQVQGLIDRDDHEGLETLYRSRRTPLQNWEHEAWTLMLNYITGTATRTK